MFSQSPRKDTLPAVTKKSSSKKKAKKSKSSSHSSEQSLAKMLTAYTDSLHRLEAQRPDPDVWMSDYWMLMSMMMMMMMMMMMSNWIDALLSIVCTIAITTFNSSHMLV